MCGRYVLKTKLQNITEAFAPLVSRLTELLPRYNIAPSQEVAAIRMDAQGQRSLGNLRWGLIPSWQPAGAFPKIQPINVKSETVGQSRMFAPAFARRRCLMVADGFYEWAQVPGKPPYFIHRTDDRPFAFAALWERWRPEGAEEPLDTVALLTTTPNALMRPLHQRMPVILNPSDFDAWLDRQTPLDRVSALLRPAEDAGWEAYPVSKRVNRPAMDGPENILPVEAT